MSATHHTPNTRQIHQVQARKKPDWIEILDRHWRRSSFFITEVEFGLVASCIADLQAYRERIGTAGKIIRVDG